MSKEHPPAQDTAKGKYGQRDAETQMVLGAFVTVMSIFVVIGTFWATSIRSVVVNLAAGLVLMGVGVTLAVFGFLGRRRLKVGEKKRVP